MRFLPCSLSTDFSFLSCSPQCLWLFCFVCCSGAFNRRSITQPMKSTSAAQIDSLPQIPTRMTETRELVIRELGQTKSTPRVMPKTSKNLVVRHATAGFIHGAVAVIAYFILENISFLPVRTLIVWMVLAWPSIPAALYGIEGVMDRRGHGSKWIEGVRLDEDRRGQTRSIDKI